MAERTASRYSEPLGAVALSTLVVQNAASLLLQHLLQTRSGSQSVLYHPLTAVTLSEALKLATCSLTIAYHVAAAAEPGDGSRLTRFADSVRHGHETAAVPAILYTLAAYCQGIGARNLPLLSYVTLSQVKLILTPLFAYVLLRQTLRWQQWLCLTSMAAGIVMVQVGSAADRPGQGPHRHPPSVGHRHPGTVGPAPAEPAMADLDLPFGIVAMLIAGGCSAFSGVYSETLLKTAGSFAARNAQLSVYSCLLALLGFILQSDGGGLYSFFQGYHPLVWVFVLLQALGGFLVAWCLQITSTVAKNYAQGMGFLVASTVPLLFGRSGAASSLFYCGSALVVAGIFASLQTNQQQKKQKLSCVEKQEKVQTVAPSELQNDGTS